MGRTITLEQKFDTSCLQL